MALEAMHSQTENAAPLEIVVSVQSVARTFLPKFCSVSWNDSIIILGQFIVQHLSGSCN